MFNVFGLFFGCFRIVFSFAIFAVPFKIQMWFTLSGWVSLVSGCCRSFFGCLCCASLLRMFLSS